MNQSVSLTCWNDEPKCGTYSLKRWTKVFHLLPETMNQSVSLTCWNDEPKCVTYMLKRWTKVWNLHTETMNQSVSLTCWNDEPKCGTYSLKRWTKVSHLHNQARFQACWCHISWEIPLLHLLSPNTNCFESLLMTLIDLLWLVEYFDWLTRYIEVVLQFVPRIQCSSLFPHSNDICVS
jgi:hypothetical protein